MDEQKKKQITEVLEILKQDFDVKFNHVTAFSYLTGKTTVTATMKLKINDRYIESSNGVGVDNATAEEQAVSNFITYFKYVFIKLSDFLKSTHNDI